MRSPGARHQALDRRLRATIGAPGVAEEAATIKALRALTREQEACALEAARMKKNAEVKKLAKESFLTRGLKRLFGRKRAMA